MSVYVTALMSSSVYKKITTQDAYIRPFKIVYVQRLQPISWISISHVVLKTLARCSAYGQILVVWFKHLG